jgi:hypothetical protein
MGYGLAFPLRFIDMILGAIMFPMNIEARRSTPSTSWAKLLKKIASLMTNQAA